EPFLLRAVDHHRAVEIALGERLSLRHHALIGIVAQGRALALAHPFHFSHGCCSFFSALRQALRRYSGAFSSCSKPQPPSTVTPSSQFGSAATNFAGLLGSALKCWTMMPSARSGRLSTSPFFQGCLTPSIVV